MDQVAADAVRAVLDSLTQFAYGPMAPETTPWQGTVTLTPMQYNTLRKLVRDV